MELTTGTAAPPKFATWSVPGHPIRIEYSAAVLEEIRLAAVEGYHRVRRGGVETGGVLFGTHGKNVVRITAWRPIACAYTKGPSFVLSEQEESDLSSMLRPVRNDPELAKLEPVGWYRAHNRSEILLSETDVSFFDRFFPQAWQVGLIVRPASFAPTRAGFFVREANGGIRTQSSYREFVLAPLQPAARRDAQPAEEEKGIKVPEPAQIAPPQPAAVAPEAMPEREASEEAASPVGFPPEPPPAVAVAPRLQPQRASLIPRDLHSRRTSPRTWYLAAGIALVAVLVLGYSLLKSAGGLSLSATDTGGMLRIAWDRTAQPIRRATGASLEIVDRGARTEVKLTPADLRSGSISYARQSGDVVMRMLVYLPGSPPLAEMTHFVGPGGLSAAAAPRVEPAPVKPTPVKKIEPAQQAAVTPARGDPPSAVQQRLFQSPAAPASVTPPSVAPPASASSKPPVPGPNRIIVPSSTIPTPAIAPPPIESQPAAPQVAALPSVLNQAPVAAPAPPQPRSGAASGKIIWTGKFPKDGRLIIEGSHASAGALSGALPARPARASAYPGNLTSAGITLYTPDPRYAQPVTESAGAENGWNLTTYTLDPKRASTVKVVEQPGPQNDYKLVLQSDSPKLSMVVIEWRATQ